MPKRKDYISWDEYFMGVAVLSSMRSKDPSTQVGACIVNPDHKIVGVGYNGFPIGVSDDDIPWEREGDWLDTKYPYVCHAELNAILNSISNSLKGCTLYVGLFPCNECAKAIIQSGIKEVVFLSDKYAQEDNTKASKRMFDQTGVTYRRLVANHPLLTVALT
ncbi:MAG: dCMP deaminase family protein [Sphaerochaeta sp.]|jgi:dCMP deaminase|uniref:deoxycytidylate deaminase n=1 Tax=Sphaerochaeta sp. TaxID=1972642 RepID=UPI002FC69B8B